MSKDVRADEAMVRSIPEPTWTDTWHPVSHAKVLDAVANACGNKGINVISKDFSLNANGKRMFATYGLDLDGNGGMKYMLGFRNALDMSFAVGFAAGTLVTVCSNMMISGDLLVFRKHTSGMDVDLLNTLADEALSGAIVKMDKLYQWHQNLKEWYVPVDDFKRMTFDMINAGVFSGGQFNNYLACVEEEKTIANYGTVLDNSRSLYVVHGGATRLLRKANLLRLSDATAKLETICDDYIDLKKAA